MQRRINNPSATPEEEKEVASETTSLLDNNNSTPTTDPESGLFAKKDNSLFDMKHSPKFSGLSFCLIFVSLLYIFILLFNSSDRAIHITSSKNPNKVSQYRVYEHMKNINKYGDRTTGSLNTEIITPQYIHNYLESLQPACRKHSWVLIDEIFHSTGSYNINNDASHIFIAYNNITNVIVSLNPMQNEGDVDYAMLSSYLINIPVDTSILSSQSFSQLLIPSSMLDIIYILTNSDSYLYNQRIIFNFCFGSQQYNQCFHSFSNHKWGTSVSRVINIQEDKDANIGLYLYKQDAPLFALGQLYSLTEVPHGNSIVSYWLSLFEYDKRRFFTHYIPTELSSDIPDLNLHVGTNMYRSSSFQPEQDKKGAVQAIVNTLYKIISQAAKNPIQKQQIVPTNQYFFVSLFGRSFISISYTNLAIISIVFVLLTILLYPSFHLNNISYAIINYIPCICLYFLSILMSAVLLFLFGFSSFWYSHPLFGVFFYGTIGFCVYILICNKEYEFKLKQYTLITPEQYVMLQYIICSCLSLILAIVKCPFVIFSLQLTLSSFLILLIPVIQRFYHSYIKKDIHLSTNELFSIQSNYTTLLFAVAVNVLPIIILVATVMKETLAIIIPVTASLGTTNQLEIEFMVTILLSFFLIWIIIAIHPFISLFSDYKLYYQSSLGFLALCILCLFILPVFSSTHPRSLILVHSTKLSTIVITERSAYKALIRGNYLDIYNTDSLPLKSILHNINLPFVPRSSLKDAFTLFSYEHYQSMSLLLSFYYGIGLHAQLDKEKFTPLFNKKYPSLTVYTLKLKRDEVCTKRCIHKQTQQQWKRRIRIIYDFKVVGGVHFIEIISDKILSWNLSSDLPLPVETISTQIKNKVLYKYNIIYYAGRNTNRLTGEVYFMDNSDIIINVYSYYSTEILKENKVSYYPDIQYIRDSFDSSIDTTLFTSLESHYLIEKYVDHRFNEFAFNH